jgi:predicted transcriptional regulator of viral defense system
VGQAASVPELSFDEVSPWTTSSSLVPCWLRGYNHDLRRLQERGELVRVRREAYATESSLDLTIDEQHRRLVRGTVPQLREGAVLSHGSAAVLHGLPVWPEAVERVHVTRSRQGNGAKRSVVQVHGAPLDPREMTMIDGVPVTSLTRTVQLRSPTN